jgi:hypothetical protein
MSDITLAVFVLLATIILGAYTIYKEFTTPLEVFESNTSKRNYLKAASVFIGLMPLVGILSFLLIYSSPESYAFISIVSGGISFFLFYGFVINLYQAGVQNQNPS